MPANQGMNPERGGTLLGFIIGALLGLGIALAVAVYVTKVPVPFMSKGLPRGSDSDAAEAKKNRDWNPNAPLAGKNPAKPAPAPAGEPAPAPAPEAAPEPEPPLASTVPDPTGAAPERAQAAVKPPKPAVVASVAPPPAAVRPARPAPSADPLGDLARARSEAPSPSSTSDPFSYFIQAGAFRTTEDAEQQRARLLLLGMQARVTEREQAGRTVYRVRVGPFDKKDDADRVKDRLDNNSIETALVRVQR